MTGMPDRSERPEYVGLGPSDWIAGCATLPPMAEWVYWQISLYCMDKGEAVPANRLAMILVRHGGNWQADIDLLIDLGKLHKTASGSLFVRRSLVEYERASAALQKKRRAGKQGAAKRWGSNDLDGSAKPEDSTANGDAIKNRCDTNSSRAEQSRADTNHSSNDIVGAPDLLFTIDEDTWADFAEHRVKLRAPLTDRAGTMIRNELMRFHEQHGHDPNAVLRQSMMRGWKGVFALKDDDNGNGRKSGWRFDDER